MDDFYGGANYATEEFDSKILEKFKIVFVSPSVKNSTLSKTYQFRKFFK